MHTDDQDTARDDAFHDLEAAVLGVNLGDAPVNLTMAVHEPMETPFADPVVETAVETDAVAAFDPMESEMLEIERLAEQQPEEPFRSAGSGFFAVVAALAWVGVAVGAPAAFLGPNTLQYQHPAILVGIAAIAIAPALMLLYAAAAAREAMRVRRETADFARRASEALSPSDVEERARTLGETVRAEIGALQTVVETALDRFAELEAAAARNAIVFDQAVSNARDGAGILSKTLSDERIAFEDLTTELRGQSDTLGENVGRQIRLMREASRLVRQEYVAADETLQAHLTSFAAAAALMAERTEAIDGAATATHMAAQRLDGTIVSALDALAQATSLTDTARQSAENATQAANATASAVRETTLRAVADARRVAHMIRNETQAMEDTATATLAKLKDAADEARRASEEAQAAADRHAASIQRRLSAMAGAAQVVQKQPVVETVVEEMPVAERMVASAGGRPVRMVTEVVEAPRFANDWTPPPSANDSGPGDRFNLVAKSPAETALAMLAQVGVNAGETFATADLDFIASRARQGGASRRQAVTAAAPEAVHRLQDLFAHDAAARADAVAFRAKPDLATQPGGKQVLIAYLLVDAALG